MLMITALVAIFTIGLGERADGELSAYSVFNRGFQRLLGSIDVDELVNQHVGGGFMNMNVHADDGEERENIRPAALRNNNNNNDNDDESDDNDSDDNEEDNNNNNQQHQQRGARRSGKKARRRNLEERREQQRQREAARAMGFDGGPEEIMAMQRLIEEQVVDAARGEDR